MENRLRAYIESLFADAPATRRNIELKEELYQNLSDKYNDLLSEGKNEDSAFNIAVASLGDVAPLIDRRAPSEKSAESDERRRRSALLKSIAIMLYILCPVPLFILADTGMEIAGLVMLFVFVAAATGLLIYNGSVNSYSSKMDDTTVEEFRQWKENSVENNSTFKAISGALWSVILVVYFVVSFTTGAWHITWLIFLIGGAVESIVKAAFDLRK